MSKMKRDKTPFMIALVALLPIFGVILIKSTSKKSPTTVRKAIKPCMTCSGIPRL